MSLGCACAVSNGSNSTYSRFFLAAVQEGGGSVFLSITSFRVQKISSCMFNTMIFSHSPLTFGLSSSSSSGEAFCTL